MSWNGKRRGWLLDAVCVAAEAGGLQDLTVEVLPKLAKAFDASLIACVEVVDDNGLQLKPYLPPGMPNPFEKYWEGAYYESDPLEELRRQRLKPRVAIVTQLVDPRKYRASGLYNDITHPMGIEQVLEAHLHFGDCATAGTCAMLLFRSERRTEWHEEDVQILARVLPAFEAVFRRQALWQRSHEVIEGVLEKATSRAYLALDRLGRLLWLSSQAATLLQTILGEKMILPAPLVAAVRKLADLAASRNPDALTAGGQALSVFSLELPNAETPVQVHLSLNRLHCSGEPCVVAELSQNSRRDFAEGPGPELLQAKWALTAREAEVAGRLLQGHSNAQIAKHLFISPETVRSHLNRIFEKLGVNTRVQAVLKLQAS